MSTTDLFWIFLFVLAGIFVCSGGLGAVAGILWKCLEFLIMGVVMFIVATTLFIVARGVLEHMRSNASREVFA